MKSQKVFAIGMAIAVGAAVLFGGAGWHRDTTVAAAMSGKDQRYNIEAALATVATRAAVAHQLMVDCNALPLPQCDPSADQVLAVAVDSVLEHAREAAHLLQVYRLP